MTFGALHIGMVHSISEVLIIIDMHAKKLDTQNRTSVERCDTNTNIRKE